MKIEITLTVSADFTLALKQSEVLKLYQEIAGLIEHDPDDTLPTMKVLMETLSNAMDKVNADVQAINIAGARKEIYDVG